MLAIDLGKSLEEIVEFLLIHPETAKRHLKEFRSENKLKLSSGGSILLVYKDAGKDR